MKTGMTRRTFLKISSLLSAAGFIPSPSAAGQQVFRTLGRTGLKATEVGMGVMITHDPDIVRAALDTGINYFDTARAYMGGRNEKILGQGLKGRRREAIIATKCHHLGSKKRVINSVEKSLAALKVDVIDILQLHNLKSRDAVLLDDHLEALTELRKAGKIRFTGVTTHSNMIEVIEAAVESKFYDTVLTSFNFQSPPELAKAIEKASAAGLGVIAMKIMTGGYRMEEIPGLNPYQAALRWVLLKRSVSTTIPSMASLEQLSQNAAVMGTTTTWRDDLSLQLYASIAGSRYCRACGSCRGQCGLGADIQTGMRGLMYEEGYGETAMAHRTLANISIPCGSCRQCSVTCRFGLDVKGRMEAAADFAARA